MPAEPPAPLADDGPLAAPAGWPDITDELAEVRFLLLQGFEDEAATMLVSLRARFGGHPDLERVEAGPTPPVPIDAAEKRRRDQAVTVRTEPIAAAAAAAAADASRAAAKRDADASTSVVSTNDASTDDGSTGGSDDATSAAPSAPAEIDDAVSEPAPELPPAVTGETVISAPPRERPPAVTGETVIAPAPTAPTPEAPTPPPRAVPGATTRNAARVPPRGLTIRSEPVRDTADASPATDVPPPPARVVRAPDPSRLVATSPMPAPAPSPEDSAAETLEFDVDAEFADGADGATDSASMSTITGVREAAPAASIHDDDSDETIVDLEFDRLDRTVVSRTPPAPPVFDDEPDTGTATRRHEPVRVEPDVDADVAPELDTTASRDESDAMPELPPPADRTVIARVPSAPAPWRPPAEILEAAAAAQAASGDTPSVASTSGDAPAPRTTIVPTNAGDGPSAPAPFGGAPPPGSTLVPGTTPPSGGFGDEDHGDDHDEAATIALPSLTEAALQAAAPPPAWNPPAATTQPPAVTGQTAPPGSMTFTPPTPPAAVAPPAPAAPSTPTPAAPSRGRGRRDARPGSVRLVMLGSRGESVAERTIESGAYLDLGRDGGQPWSDDAFIEPMHARFIAVDGGARVEELVPTGAVFLRIQGRRPLNEHDQVRVGQSLLTYRRPDGDPNAGPWGSVVMHIAPDGAQQVIPLGNSGVTVGREFGEVTLAGDTFVSSTHCRVVPDASGIHIEDLESSNGTYLRMRSGEPLEIGQCVLVGQTQFVLRKR